LIDDRTNQNESTAQLRREISPKDIDSPTHGAFIASLDSVTLPKYWHDAKKDPK
jgi:Reverse transcriptase (RNA-dependent DNA polymerase)